MTWLTGWSKRLKMEIDELRIDENLSNFPVMINLSSGTGINTFNAEDVFNTITPISGTLFSEDFTANGTNWTHIGGAATTYNSSYMMQSYTSLTTRDDSNSTYDFGKYWDIKCRIYVQEKQLNQNMHGSVYIGYDTSTDNYALRIGIATADNYGAQYNNLKVGKRTGPSETLFITDTQYNYANDFRNWFWCRAQREGTKLYFKVWKHPAAEPTAWHYEIENAFTDSDLTSGKVSIQNYYQATYYDDVTIKKHYPITASKKLAMTSSDGVTQLPVEIEYWDQYDKKAYLWTKIPTVWSGTNTTFYLYYDANQQDNVPYVGYTDSIIAQSVWDSNYLLVCHMNVHPSKGYVKDSTSYNIDSTSFSPDYNNWQLTQAGLSYTFDNAQTDYINFGYNNIVTTQSGAITVESIYKPYSGSASYARYLAEKGLEFNAKKSWRLSVFGAGPYSLTSEVSSTGNTGNICSTTAKFDYNVWYYGALRFTPSTEHMLWVNTGPEITNTTSIPSALFISGSPVTGSDDILVGGGYQIGNASYCFDGEISETRISKIARSNAWLKATYYTCFNQLMNFYREVAPAGWLGTWAKRYKITIDQTKVDADLIDFPVMIDLDTSCGRAAFNASDIFTELSSVSGTLFADDFTASGINFTHNTGTTTYNLGYMYQARNSKDTSNSNYNIGKYWDITCRMIAYEYSMGYWTSYNSIYFGYDTATDNYACRFYMFSDQPPGYIKITKKVGTTETVIVNDTQWGYASAGGINTWYYIRVRREGTKLFCKIWKYGSLEPTGWNYEVENAYDDSDLTNGKIVVMNSVSISAVDDVLVQTHASVKAQKIAVTTSDGITQCPVEIEYWDQYTKQAFLWTKLPIVYNEQDTVFYLYYDKTQLDNTNYVGYTDSAPAQNVWDSNYKFVGHMNTCPSKGYMRDSTSNDIDSTAFTVDVNNYLTRIYL
jgi:hypothetical protein